MLTIGIYPRKSVYRDNSDSVQVQIQLCRDYAGIIYKDQDTAFRIYDQDEGFSGKNTNRPGFRKMMRDVENGSLDVVMVYRLDRISRNVQEFSSMYQIFQQHNVSFISVKESFDTTTPMGRTVMYILAAFAQLERENTSERVTDNMLALGAAGKWTGGRCPCGMRSVRQKCGDKEHSFLQTDPEKIWLPRLLYRLLLDGCSITAIERYCRDHGIRSQSGKFLSSSRIHSILTNPVYCQNSREAWQYFRDAGCSLPEQQLFDGKHGLIGYGKTRTGAASQPRQKLSLWTIAIGIHEPVIPADLWISAQKRLGINKQLRTSKHQAGILKGVLKCSCGTRMEVRTYYKNHTRFSYYYCTSMARQGKSACPSKYVRTEKIDQCFLREFQSIRLDPDSFQEPCLSDHSPGAESVLKEIRKLDNAIRNLSASLTQAAGSAAAGHIIARINELDQQRAFLDQELVKARSRGTKAQSCEESKKEFFCQICFLRDHFDLIDYSGQNELIRKAVKECVFDGQKLHIIF